MRAVMSASPPFLRTVGLAPGASRSGYPNGIPAVAALGMATAIETDDPDDGVNGRRVNGDFPDFHARSHGEAFRTLVEDRFTGAGFYVMDEPESALSFEGQLGLLRFVHDGVRDGAQFLVATHSPLLMRAPGAVIYELGDHGIRRCEWEELQVVQLWRRFLDAPERMLDVLLSDDD